jgi:hypothetical protein
MASTAPVEPAWLGVSPRQRRCPRGCSARLQRPLCALESPEQRRDARRTVAMPRRRGKSSGGGSAEEASAAPRYAHSLLLPAQGAARCWSCADAVGALQASGRPLISASLGRWQRSVARSTSPLPSAAGDGVVPCRHPGRVHATLRVGRLRCGRGVRTRDPGAPWRRSLSPNCLALRPPYPPAPPPFTP